MASDAEPVATWHLDTLHIGRQVEIYDQLDSTNNLALALGNDPARDGLAILARQQSAGRGQHGRTWAAPPGSSVLLSVLLFTPAHLRRPALLTAWAAVSVAEAIRSLTGQQARIKWPNDVLLHGKKVCGILIEQRNSGHPDAPLATVVGIGLNVSQPAEFFAAAGLPLGGSLASVAGCWIEAADVARRLIVQLDDEYDRLVRGDFASLEGNWIRRLGLLGKTVEVEGIARTLRGRLRELAFTGLEVETDAGDLVHLVPEAVRHLHAVPGERA